MIRIEYSKLGHGHRINRMIKTVCELYNPGYVLEVWGYSTPLFKEWNYLGVASGYRAVHKITPDLK